MNKIDNIISILNENNFPVLSNEELNEYYRIKIKGCYIFFIEYKNEICLSFDITVKPEYASFLTLILTKFLHISSDNFFIIESYYDKQNNTYFGNKAYQEYMKDMYDNIVFDYKEHEKEYELIKKKEPTMIN